MTWSFAFARFGLRDEVAVDYRFLAVAGGVVGALFALALAGHLTGAPWSSRLAVALAAFDIIGEFVAQGTLSILVTVSFVVVIAVLLLAWSDLRAVSHGIVGGKSHTDR